MNSATVFFYILLRDKMTVGQVEKIFNDFVDKDINASFTCPHTQALAEDYAERLGCKES